MYKVFDNIEEYNEYTENGNRLTSGVLYIIGDGKRLILRTNNIDGEFKVYDLKDEAPAKDYIVESTVYDPTATYSGAFNPKAQIVTANIPSGFTSIGGNAFSSYESLTSVTIPDSVTSIDMSAFFYCTGLTSITIPDSVTSIGQSAFSYCSNLNDITIPSGVTSIGNQAFYYCEGLTSVTIQATTPPTLGFSTFDGTNNCPIYVPAESVDTYKAATNWNSLASRIQAIPTE